ncbi:hypothetical protein RM190_08525 [Paracoccus sp. CPCC 101403]|uniref:Head-tail adaptor protein n=1 Tax=Paracoccus broussonetiae TaxID=3075834 RepID=A0ABU3ECE2_9RHOB|nr:hypothetical protein [Paracoccus sp. CPCC 101403]MDT1061898.1 hypothetical protein [Paracoccus sp. CPCC 101403]
MSIFDGMTGILSGILGGTVGYVPATGFSRQIQSIFRESPIEVEGADGQIVRIDAPTWRVGRDLAPETRRGDRITVPDGRTFQIMVVHPNGSPAADAFLICELQIVGS